MAPQYSKKTLVFSAVGSLMIGLVVGGLLTRAFFLPASPPVVLDISAQLTEAHALLDKNLLADAERSYRAILGTDPGNTEAVSHLGNVAFQQGDIERAVRFYDMALQQDPSYAHALWDKGIALRAKGDNAGAIKAWEALHNSSRLIHPTLFRSKSGSLRRKHRLIRPRRARQDA